MIKIIKNILLGFTALAVIIGAWFLVNKFVYRSKASAQTISVYLNPLSTTVFTGDNIVLSVMLQGNVGASVSGATVMLEYDKDKLQALSSGEETNAACRSLETKVGHVVNTSGTKGTVKITKVAVKKDNELPSGAFCFSTVYFKSIASGSAEVKITDTPANLDISGPVSLALQKDTTKSTAVLTIKSDNGTPTLQFALKLQGVSKKPSGAAKVPLKITATTSGGNFSKVFSNVEATSDASGVWKGSLTMSGVEPGNNYRILIKGPKHLQRKYCHLTPTVEASGAYNCGTATITLRTGANTADFTALPILVGDLPVQDGLLNARDASVLRQNVFKTTDDALNVADLNYDGAANGTDYSLMIQSMQLKYDEED